MKPKTPKVRLSDPQRRCLLNALDGLPLSMHCDSMSDYGGLMATVQSLCRRGYLDWKTHRLTAAGRRLAKSLRGNPMANVNPRIDALGRYTNPDAETAAAVARWLSQYRHLRDVALLSVTIRGKVYFGAAFTNVQPYTERDPAVLDGRRKAGDEGLSRRIYLVGELPASYVRRKAYYRWEGKEWFVGCYYQANVHDYTQAQFREYHPFGQSFDLHLWDLPEAIDWGESTVRDRVDMTVTPLGEEPARPVPGAASEAPAT
jgi:hypothetical protein